VKQFPEKLKDFMSVLLLKRRWSNGDAADGDPKSKAADPEALSFIGPFALVQRPSCGQFNVFPLVLMLLCWRSPSARREPEHLTGRRNRMTCNLYARCAL
jgi:hypothetical protein